jgi:hypothetical protein
MPRLATPLLLVAFLLAASPAPAAPAAAEVVGKMRAAIWPDRPSVRKLAITITADDGESTRVMAGQARKRIGGKERMVTVVLAPADARGTAWLVEDAPDAPVQWVYAPATRRVREMVPASGYQPFFGSDFTFADVGLITPGAKATIRGDLMKNGVQVWVVEQAPDAPWYYGKIVTDVAQDSALPLQREFYAPSGELWKVEHFRNVTRIDGVPTVLKFVMEDRRQGGRTEVDVAGVRYDVEVPDALLDPRELPRAAGSPLWG